MSMTSWLRQEVEELYARNRQRGKARWCGLEYDFVCPSQGTYPFQWLWDSCFHAIVLSHIDVVRAQSEIRGLLAHAHEDGAISHVIFWQREKYEDLLAHYNIAYRTPYLSDCMQPPVLAEAVAAVARRSGDSAFLQEALPTVRRYYDWLDRVRDPDRDGLIAILQPDESGLDHAPKYDTVLGVAEPTKEALDEGWKRVADAHDAAGRDPTKMFEHDRFVVEDTLVNSIYAENQQVLAELLEQAGDATGAAEFRARGDKTAAALAEKCFDRKAGLFFDLAGRNEAPLRTSTISSLMPLLLPSIPDEMSTAMVRHLSDPGAYACAFPVPSVALNESSFFPDERERLVWRGATWINTNWYLARGLRRHGHDDLAQTLTERSIELVRRSGFREYYNPFTGQGYGATDFSWSALVLDMAIEGKVD